MLDTKKLLERISRLAQSCPELAHTYRFAAGAVFALASAYELGHRNRASYKEVDCLRHLDDLKEVCDSVSNGAAPPAQWQAGFYYNAAIMRIAACYERLLKAVIEAINSTPPKTSCRRSSTTEQMAKWVENGLQTGSLERTHLESVRREVNNLKHGLFGQGVPDAWQRINVDDLSNACAALSELLAIVENQKILSCIKSKYTSLPPP